MKNKSMKLFYLLIFSFIIMGFVFPIFSLVQNVDFSEFKNIISSEQFNTALSNSLFVTSIGTIISVALAYIVAYGINKTNIKYKKTILLFMTLPMLIPSISHGLGLINIFGKVGIINSLLGTAIEINGPLGIIIGSILYSFPVALIIISDAFKYINESSYENAEVLGLTRFQQFKVITLYYMKKPIFSAVFAVFTMIFTDYGVPMVVGGTYQTLPVYLYREVIGLLDYNKGTIIGMFLLIPAVISFIFDLFNKEINHNNKINKNYNRHENKITRIFISIIIYSIILFEVILFSSFILMAFYENYPSNLSFSLIHFENVFSGQALIALKNSILIAFLTGLFGTIIAYSAAYITSRTQNKIKKILHILAISTLAVPGLVLGVSFTIAFKGTIIYNTLIIIIIVNIIHFFATPYLIAYNALGKLNINYESVGEISGISKFKIIKDVIIPNTKYTIYEMFSYMFINGMITISAVTFLYSYDNMPISLLINQYEGQMMLEEAAIVSILILTINIIMKIIINLLKKEKINET